jgi:hypothetical protein
MKRTMGFWLVVALLAGSAVTLTAQATADGVMPPPKVLVVLREFLKPGKAGSPHQKTESAFVQAFTGQNGRLTTSQWIRCQANRVASF